MNEPSPPWTELIDALALQALRTHFQVELDLRAVLRSQDEPESVLKRAESILERGVIVAKEYSAAAWSILLLNRFDLTEDGSLRMAEQIGAMHLLLLARISGWACMEYFRKQKYPDAIGLSRNVSGLVPLWVDLEVVTRHYFEDSRRGAGIPEA